MMNIKRAKNLFEFFITLNDNQIMDILKENKLWSNEIHNFKFNKLDVENSIATYYYDTMTEKRLEFDIYMFKELTVATIR